MVARLAVTQTGAGSSPAGGTAEWTGVRHQHGLISRSHAGSNPASATSWSGSVAAARRPGKRGRPGSTPGRTSLGLLVQQQDAAVARRRSRCDSPAVHSNRGQESGNPPALGAGERGFDPHSPDWNRVEVCVVPNAGSIHTRNYGRPKVGDVGRPTFTEQPLPLS